MTEVLIVTSIAWFANELLPSNNHRRDFILCLVGSTLGWLLGTYLCRSCA